MVITPQTLVYFHISPSHFGVPLYVIVKRTTLKFISSCLRTWRKNKKKIAPPPSKLIYGFIPNSINYCYVGYSLIRLGIKLNNVGCLLD